MATTTETVESDRPRVFAELFGCMAATSLGLVGGDALHPAITVPGIKTGYRRELLRLMGLRMGQGADTLIYSDVNEDLVQLHQILTTPALARETAQWFRTWEQAGEDPKALFFRLKQCPSPLNLSEWAARHLWLRGNSVKSTGEYWENQQHAGARSKISLSRLAKRLDGYAGAPWPAMLIQQVRAESLHLGGDLSGWYVLLDPPYEGMTGYTHTCTRDDLVNLAIRLHHGGAVVAICESGGLAHLLGPGWHTVNITEARQGQHRRWSKNKAEWVTVNRPPYTEGPIRPARQSSLYFR